MEKFCCMFIALLLLGAEVANVAGQVASCPVLSTDCEDGRKGCREFIFSGNEIDAAVIATQDFLCEQQPDCPPENGGTTLTTTSPIESTSSQKNEKSKETTIDTTHTSTASSTLSAQVLSVTDSVSVTSDEIQATRPSTQEPEHRTASSKHTQPSIDSTFTTQYSSSADIFGYTSLDTQTTRARTEDKPSFTSSPQPTVDLTFTTSYSTTSDVFVFASSETQTTFATTKKAERATLPPCDISLPSGGCWWAEVHSTADVTFANATKMCSDQGLLVLRSISSEVVYSAIMLYLRAEAGRKSIDSLNVWIGVTVEITAGVSGETITPSDSYLSWASNAPDRAIGWKNIYLHVASNGRNQGMKNQKHSAKLHGVVCEILT